MQLLYFYTGDTLTHEIEEDMSSNDDAGLLTCYISTSSFFIITIALQILTLQIMKTGIYTNSVIDSLYL